MSKARDSVEDLKTLDANLAAKLPKAGGTMTGDTLHGDNVKAKFGTGGDLEIYHDGSDSIIADVGNGDLKIKASNDLVLSTHDGEAYIACVQNGAVKLYYDRSAHSAAKLETSATGVDVTGTATANGLTATSTTTSGNLRVQNSASGAGASDGVLLQSNSNAAYLWNYEAGDMIFATANAEVMRLSSKNVGVGVTPEAWPSAFLGIDYGASGAIFAHRTASEHSILNNAYYDGAWKYKNTAAASRLAFSATGLDFFTAASGSANSALTWAAAASVTANGITFNGDTAAANALDDYETGSWTPVVKLGTTVQSAGTTKGRYTKVGNMVHIQCTITGITKNGTGAMLVHGLPFTVAASASAGDVQALVRWANFTTNGTVQAYFNQNSTYMMMQNISSSGFAGDITDGNCSSTYQLYGISGSYIV